MYIKDRVPKGRKPVDFDNFLGLGKRARARKDERVRIRNMKKIAKIEDRSYKKHVKADALAKRYSGKAEAAIIAAQGEAAANQMLAQQGIVGNPVTQQPDLGQQALGVAGGLLGGSGLQDSSIGITTAQDYRDDYPDVGQGDYQSEAPKKSNNTMMIVIIAAVAIGGFFLMKRK